MTPPTAPDIDFRQIRPHGSPASRSGGFEEVASLIIKDGVPGLIDWPEKVTFHRFGNPDGGREGKGVLEDGDVWAWPAKYLFALGDPEIAQVHKSVVRVLDTEPDLSGTSSHCRTTFLPGTRPAKGTVALGGVSVLMLLPRRRLALRCVAVRWPGTRWSGPLRRARRPQPCCTRHCAPARPDALLGDG